jgi:hypothetical protein
MTTHNTTAHSSGVSYESSVVIQELQNTIESLRLQLQKQELLQLSNNIAHDPDYYRWKQAQNQLSSNANINSYATKPVQNQHSDTPFQQHSTYSHSTTKTAHLNNIHHVNFAQTAPTESIKTKIPHSQTVFQTVKASQNHNNQQHSHIPTQTTIPNPYAC